MSSQMFDYDAVCSFDVDISFKKKIHIDGPRWPI